jgi:acyl carrier protein
MFLPRKSVDEIFPERPVIGSMQEDAVARGLVRVLVKILKVRPEEIRPESSLTTDLRADSLDLAEIAAELEDEFNVKVSEAEVHTIGTVGDAIAYVRRLQQTVS